MEYTCGECGKEVADEYTAARVRCPYCGYRAVVKGRSVTTTVKAR